MKDRSISEGIGCILISIAIVILMFGIYYVYSGMPGIVK